MCHAPQISGQVDIQYHACRFVRQSDQDSGNSVRVNVYCLNINGHRCDDKESPTALVSVSRNDNARADEQEWCYRDLTENNSFFCGQSQLTTGLTSTVYWCMASKWLKLHENWFLNVNNPFIHRLIYVIYKYIYTIHYYNSTKICWHMNQLCQSKNEWWNFMIGLGVFIYVYYDRVYADESISSGNQNLTHELS